MTVIQTSRGFSTGFAIVAFVAALLVSSLLALQWGRTASERDRTWPSESFDEVHFHRPVLEQFADELPMPNLRDYRSATTPGYHLLGALIDRLAGTGAVRIFFAAVCLLLPLLLYFAAAPRAGPLAASLMALTLSLSNYYLAAAVWLTTDNFALLFVTASIIAMMTAFDRANRSDGSAWRWLLFAGLTVICAVLVRQIHIWLCGPLFVSALVCCRRDPRPLVAGVAGCTASVVVVGAFVLMWGGLTPPGFAAQHAGGWNFAALAYILALFGCFSVCYVGYLAPHRDDWLVIIIGAVAGLVVSLVLVTTPSAEAGRWGGVLWHAADRLPVVANRSLLFVALCPLGGASALLWLKRTWHAGGGILLLALLAFAVAQTANFQVWQRYCEPFLLVLCALLAARSDERRRWAPWGIAALLIGLAVLTVLKVYLPLI